MIVLQQPIYYVHKHSRDTFNAMNIDQQQINCSKSLELESDSLIYLNFKLKGFFSTHLN